MPTTVPAMSGPMSVMTSSSPVMTPSAAAFGRCRIGPSTIVTTTDTNTTRMSWPRIHWPTTTCVLAAICWTLGRSFGSMKRNAVFPNRSPSSSRKNVTIKVRTMSRTPWSSCCAASRAPSGVCRKASTAACAWPAISSTVNVLSPIVMLSAPRTWWIAIVRASGPLRIRSAASRDTGPAKAMATAASTTSPAA